MYSNMCVKIALCLALIVSIDGYVLKHHTLALSAEGMTVEITVRSKEDPRHPIATTRVDINEKDKTVVIATVEVPAGAPRLSHNDGHVLLPLEDRNGVIVLGNCPHGKIRKGNFCLDPKYVDGAEDYEVENEPAV